LPAVLDLATIAARLAPSLACAHQPREGPGAAVAAVLRPGSAGAEALLIRRAERAGDPWSGHMAFPGGRRDAGDADLYATAVRETREEVGLDLDAHGTLLGRLEDLPAVAKAKRIGLTITPFVFALTHEVALTFDAVEVADALWAPLGPLARGESADTFPYSVEGRTVELPCWRVEGRVVWGLTYRMLQSLFEVLQG
jgi:8-oxo-dGTP pyrophosphatase MutT (NUDIX family)